MSVIKDNPGIVSSGLDSDPVRGLKTSTTNNQPLMAMRYILQIVENLQREIDSLKAQLAESSRLTTTTETSVEVASAPRKSKKENNDHVSGS